MGIYGARIIGESAIQKLENIKKINFSSINNFIKNEKKRNIITGNGLTIGLTFNSSNSPFEFKNIHKRAEYYFKIYYGEKNHQFKTINSYSKYLRKIMQNIITAQKLGVQYTPKKIKAKITLIENNWENELYEYWDINFKKPIILHRQELFMFSYFLEIKKWNYEDLDFISSTLKIEPVFLNHNLPIILAIKYSYINAIWLKGNCINKELINLNLNKNNINQLINEKIMTLNYDSFTEDIFCNNQKKCLYLHGSLKEINIHDFKKNTDTKVIFNQQNKNIWNNKTFMEIFLHYMQWESPKIPPKTLMYPLITLSSFAEKKLNERLKSYIQNIEGTILIVGANFFNEFHILEEIEKNLKIKNVYYVYHENKEVTINFIATSLNKFSKNIFLIESKDFYNFIKI